MKTKDEVIDGYLSRHTPEGQVIRSELNGIWDNGYQAGLRYNEEKLEIETTRQYNKGYANGLEEAQDQDYQNGYDKGADDGRYELWLVIKKLFLVPDEGGFSMDDNLRIFGGYINFSDILRNYTPEEVIEKVKSYEESKKSAPTNRDKFEEVFGIRPDEDRQSVVIMSGDGGPRYIDLDEPYEEPEKNDSVESDVNRFWN